MPAMIKNRPVLLFYFLFLFYNAWPQQTKSIRTQQQVWIAYMTSARISEKHSLWNDFHYVPNGFWVARTGLTRHWANASFTTGFAYLGLPLSPEQTNLRRSEYRPWAQLTWNASPHSGSRITLNTRIRYDARFRQAVENGALLDEYTFVNRGRVALSARYNLGSRTESWQPFVNVGTELLLNFGKSVTFNTFDQFRINGTVGVNRGTISVQTGYMYRLVQTGPYSYIGNHTWLWWITHRISLAKEPQK
jgi:Protein of unknown function (DUF2490)